MYGEKTNIKNAEFSREDILQILQTIYKCYKTLRLAYTLFFIDNIREIKKFCPDVKIREEAEFLGFATGLASQGFEVKEFKKNSNEAKLVVKDMSNLNPDVRRFHASQFLFPIWDITRSKKVIVEYREKDDTPNLLVSASSSICEKIYKEELNPIALAEIMEMVDLKTGKIIPSWKNENCDLP